MSHDVLARFKDHDLCHAIRIETATHYTTACGLWVERVKMTKSWCAKNHVCEDCNKRKDSTDA